MEYQRIEFETNIDELVDANERYWKRTRVGQSQRRRGVINVAAAFTVSLFVTAFVLSGAAVAAIAPVVTIALVLGAACWPLYGRLYDSAFNRRLRRVVTEQAGHDKTWNCEIELRREGVWSRSRGIEFLFDWHELSAIEDSREAIEFHFRGGFAMARNRAFATAAEREEFLETGRRLAAC